MDNFFVNWFKPKTREIPSPVSTLSKTEKSATVSGASFGERIVFARDPLTALTVSTVYRAVELRAKTIGVMPVQYRKKDSEKGNFTVDMGRLGKRINYLLQQEPNPVMSASSLWELVTINRLMTGNGFVYIERDEIGLPLHLWLVREGGYNLVAGTYNISYLGENGYIVKVNVPRSDVLHFPNTFRTQNGFWGISTLQFAIETLSLNKTLKNQSLETAAKGGRVKLLIGEQQQGSGVSPISMGYFDKSEMDKYAQELQSKMYAGQDVLAIRGLGEVKQISMTQAEMQAIEQVGMTDDDVARFWGTPRPLLMLDTNSHYNDYQNATMEYHTRSILPDTKDMEKEIFRKLIGFEGYGSRDIHICEKPLLAMDPERKAKYYESMLRSGIMTVNEMRAEEDMPSVKDGDIVYVLTNLAELGSAKLRDVAGGGRPTAQEPQKQEPPKEGEAK